MARLLFLVLAIVGAFAAIFAIVLGVGVMQLARSNAMPPPAVAQGEHASKNGKAGAPAAQAPGALAPVEEIVPQGSAQDAKAANAPTVDRPADPAAVVPVAQVVPVAAGGAALPADAEALMANPDPKGRPKALGLYVVAAKGIKPLAALTDGSAIDLTALGTREVSLAAKVSGKVVSARFTTDGGNAHVEGAPPYTILGDGAGHAVAWRLSPGEHTVTMTPYAHPGASGDAGEALTVHFTVLRPGERAAQRQQR